MYLGDSVHEIPTWYHNLFWCPFHTHLMAISFFFTCLIFHLKTSIIAVESYIQTFTKHLELFSKHLNKWEIIFDLKVFERKYCLQSQCCSESIIMNPSWEHSIKIQDVFEMKSECLRMKKMSRMSLNHYQKWIHNS